MGADPGGVRRHGRRLWPEFTPLLEGAGVVSSIDDRRRLLVVHPVDVEPV